RSRMSEPTTPLMRQYQAIKTRYPHALVLFRLGDFYELFYEDAIVASRELQITLTSRNRERNQPVPMCGVPYHAAENYIARLIRAGYKVAVCDQMELPSPGKKLVRREVVRVITPGTATDLQVLEPKENNFLAALARDPSAPTIGLAYVDISTGEFQATEFTGAEAEEKLRDELQLLRPREILLPRPVSLFPQATGADLDGIGGVETRLEEWVFRDDYAERLLIEQFGVVGLEGFGLAGHRQAASAAGALVHYLRETSAKGDGSETDRRACPPLQHLDRVRYYEQQEALVLDSVTVRNLELVAPLFAEEATRAQATTLLVALDETSTGMGARLLRSWILRPEIARPEIEERLDAVGQLKANTVLREEIRKELSGVLDLERLASRVTLGVASPRDLLALQGSLARIPVLRSYLAKVSSARLAALHGSLDELADVRERIQRAIADDPPPQVTDAGVIRRGYDPELDELRERIQRRLFAELRAGVAQQAARLRQTAAGVAQLDVLVNLARLAATHRYSRPEFTDSGELLIVGGRHPVIEQLLTQRGERFVPNDLYLHPASQQILLITGPNMGGKSTYLRQAALIVLMAQMGSYVPAEQARLPVIDRIFTRIGASDNLARGRSTFLVEMSEVAAILNTATPASLVLLDEVGRGTATFDGLSIAWAVVEHLQAHTRARTLFATHYHELTELAELLPGVKNVHVSVKEAGHDIVFLRRVEPGSADKSYGIEVARLAGLPRTVIERAREILRRHEQSERQLSEKLSPGAASAPDASPEQQV